MLERRSWWHPDVRREGIGTPLGIRCGSGGVRDKFDARKTGPHVMTTRTIAGVDAGVSRLRYFLCTRCRKRTIVRPKGVAVDFYLRKGVPTVLPRNIPDAAHSPLLAHYIRKARQSVAVAGPIRLIAIGTLVPFFRGIFYAGHGRSSDEQSVIMAPAAIHIGLIVSPECLGRSGRRNGCRFICRGRILIGGRRVGRGHRPRGILLLAKPAGSVLGLIDLYDGDVVIHSARCWGNRWCATAKNHRRNHLSYAIDSKRIVVTQKFGPRHALIHTLRSVGALAATVFTPALIEKAGPRIVAVEGGNRNPDGIPAHLAVCCEGAGQGVGRCRERKAKKNEKPQTANINIHLYILSVNDLKVDAIFWIPCSNEGMADILSQDGACASLNRPAGIPRMRSGGTNGTFNTSSEPTNLETH